MATHPKPQPPHQSTFDSDVLIMLVRQHDGDKDSDTKVGFNNKTNTEATDSAEFGTCFIQSAIKSITSTTKPAHYPNYTQCSAAGHPDSRSPR